MLKEQESVIKRILKFNHYKKCLFKNKIILKLQQKFKSETHNVYAEEINKVALGSHDDNNNDDIKTFDIISAYPCGSNALILCESEMLSKYK